MSLDELEVELRKLAGVVAVAFVEADGLLVIEVQSAGDAPDYLAQTVTNVALQHTGATVAVEVVRWGDGGPHRHEARLRFVEVATDPAAGTLLVRLARDEEESVGRAPTEHGLMSAVEATVYAVRAFLPALSFLPGWARTIETMPDRRFLVVASVTDPAVGHHLRGVAEGTTPIEAAARATLSALNRSLSREL
ncbi:MAG: hypothetical protein WEB19_00390 [Acidimicrobiia bacterium]